MVDFGQAGIAELGYANPRSPHLGLEAMTFAQLRSRTKKRVAASPIRADFHQLTVVRAGRGLATVDFVSFECGPGSVLHVRPGQIQRLPVVPDGSGLAELDAIVLLFTADFPPQMPSVLPLLDLDFGPALLQAPDSERARLYGAAGDLEAEYRLITTRDEAARRLTAELLRQLLAGLLLRIARLPIVPGADPAIENGSEVFRALQREVEMHFATTRDVRDYAVRLGYSPRTLTRACLAATGRTTKQYLDARVVLEAKRLLVHTDLTVTAISRVLGFIEPTNFGKFFTRETGMTPGAFRGREHA